MALSNRLKKWKRKIKIALSRPKEKKLSQSIDISKVSILCMVLGPYRNLTTLTGSIMSLHPNCQVLNHGIDRIMGDKKLNFLQNYSMTTLDNFLKYAIFISGGGQRGNYGGSITFSHAYAENSEMSESYRHLFGDKMVKDEIHCLFWKESLHITNILQKFPKKFTQILNENPNIKFILPVRNTLDCVESNISTGMATIYPDIGKIFDRKILIRRILEDYHWFFSLKKRYPERFFWFFQDEINREKLLQLAKFLNLSGDECWLNYALKNYHVRSKYKHTDEARIFFQETVNTMFRDFPEERCKLLEFTGEN
ncbi:MAG: hypothetical protein JXQ65_07605 [Candidatus Marinimicrobia bacterium]|nr:hypothetical protein [Candidatus Neomarinimicrobiota bacterium]